ncbi:hypothetical protein EGT07_22995 [Herbaspirillum sp. HC18]|nr:hypothetical protein EGT07_22995 [Herbaspirillum sp. HC18]
MYDTTHLIAFLIGTATGAAGTYMADKLTDQRREKAEKKAAKAKFSDVQDKMPYLIREIKEDLSKAECTTFREFVILPTERTTFNHDKPRFEYYESVHPHAKNQVTILESAEYVQNVSTTSWPIYRMTEEFVQRVLEQA